MSAPISSSYQANVALNNTQNRLISTPEEYPRYKNALLALASYVIATEKAAEETRRFANASKQAETVKEFEELVKTTGEAAKETELLGKAVKQVKTVKEIEELAQVAEKTTEKALTAARTAANIAEINKRYEVLMPYKTIIARAEQIMQQRQA